MAQDPLSIPTTILPESSFDPVQFAKERRQEVLTEQKERRERYNKAWESVGTPSSTMSRDVYADIMKRKSDLVDRMAARSAEGVDITDISHPKYGREAMEFKGELERLGAEADQTKALDQYLATVRQTIAKDVNGVIDVDATNKNIDKLRSLKNMDEVNQFMSEKGDNLIELKKPKFDVDDYITSYMKKKGIKGIEKSIEDKKGNYLFTDIYNEIPKEQVVEMFTDMLKDPEFSKGIKEMRSNDASDLRGGSDLDYILERRGNKVARQYLKFKQEYVEPDKVDTTEQPVSQSSEPERLNIVYKTGVGDKEKSYTATGENTYTYNQSKTPNLRLGEGVINVNSGETITEKDFVDFTPISSSEYYVANKKLKGGPNAGWWDEGTILSDSPNNRANPDAGKKRFVLGVYTAKRNIGTKDDPEIIDKKFTVLVPYDNVKNTLDKIYDVKGGFPQSKETNIEDFSPQINNAIQNFMSKNGISERTEAIKILKENGRL